jgi:hypothetical protein
LAVKNLEADGGHGVFGLWFNFIDTLIFPFLYQIQLDFFNPAGCAMLSP